MLQRLLIVVAILAWPFQAYSQAPDPGADCALLQDCMVEPLLAGLEDFFAAAEGHPGLALGHQFGGPGSVAFEVGAFQTQSTFTFPNNTPDPANDLHVKFKQAVTVFTNPDTGDADVWQDIDGNGTTSMDFSNPTAAVPAAGSSTLKFRSTSNDIEVKEWWWTVNGVRSGPKNEGNP